MEQYKIDRLKEIKREVEDFHPILHSLFNKMPDITRVEYNQGNREMGADFVLEKSDNLLDETCYVGVIVKVGKILQNHQEINRQIEECDIDRFFNGGKIKISISEIWVVTNESITANAQEKINHYYRTKNVRFIDYSKLGRLMDKYYPEFWTDTNQVLCEYIRKTHEQIVTTLRSSSLGDTSNIYIEPRLSKIDDDYSSKTQRIRKRQKSFSIDEILELESCVLIEGSMGTGKSSLLQKLMEKRSTPENLQTHKTIPILVSFKEALELGEDAIKKLIDKTSSAAKISKDEYNFLIGIDAIDEVELDESSRASALQNLSTQSRAFENTKLICTSRGSENPQEKASTSKYFTRFQILPLSIGQVLQLIEQICRSVDIKSKLQNDLRNSQLFKVLPRTPISAILLGKLLNEDQKEIPSTMTELYSKYMELVLGRWDMTKGLQSQKEYEIIENASTEIAKHLIEHNRAKLTIDEAKYFFENYTKTRNLKIDVNILFKKFLSKSDLVSFNENTNFFAFKHRTFTEFFYAKSLHRENNAVIDEKIYDPYWSTSYFFYIGIKRDCPELIDAINSMQISNDLRRLLKIVNNGNFLLAAYLTPYNHITNGVDESYTEAARYLKETFDGNISNPLSNLTKMHALCLITKCLNDTFRFEYFKEAIGYTATDVTYTKNPTELDFLKLFLLRNTSLELGETTAFDTLLEEHNDELPVYLRLAIQHETEDSGKETSIVTRFNKKLTKQLKSSGNTRTLINKLYKIPLNKQNLALPDQSKY